MSDAGTVAVITDDEDTTASRVTAELAVRGVRVVMFDAADFPTRLRLAATIEADGRWSGTLMGETSHGEPVEVDLSEVCAVYYRKPTQFQLADGMSGPEQMWAYKEARRGFGGVLRSLDCLWVNDPVQVAAAEYKPVQLQVAAQAGLNVPRTTITNDPDHAHSWAKQLGRAFVYKPLGGAFHTDTGQVRVVYTARLDDPDQVRDPDLTLTAHMLQEWIDKSHDCRAIVVGDRVFTVAIHAASDAAHVDWRADYDALDYELCEPPTDVRRALVDLHQQLGLTFGAVDLAVTTSGDWIFYETNPSGQYGWLVEECGLPVAEALADVLQRGRP